MCSPTINMWISPEDYIRFVQNLDSYLEMPFKKSPIEAGYPIGMLGDVKLHCIHYSDFDMARVKWTERCKRVNKERIILTLTDQNHCSDIHVEAFMKLTYPKIFITSQSRYKGLNQSVFMDSRIYQREHRGRTLVDDAFLFKGLSGHRIYEDYFDFVFFLDCFGCTGKSDGPLC